ncbi:unnamed protein product [Toxocara canis]|uniref:Uncharacterized protein n=1 Tax=Toxocara canis TaxID=6265 RepID=A0A3P7H431_TOXCA|nr:unnamed protein product [Toxocara canis]
MLETVQYMLATVSFNHIAERCSEDARRHAMFVTARTRIPIA